MTTIAESVAADLSAIIGLGFSDSQAKTIIVSRTMYAANISKQIAPGQPANLWTVQQLITAANGNLTYEEMMEQTGKSETELENARLELRKARVIA